MNNQASLTCTVSAGFYMSPAVLPKPVMLTVGPAVMPSSAQTQSLIVQAVIGWSVLDYHVRIAVKRLTGQNLDATEVVEMMSAGTHQEWLGELSNGCAKINLSPEQRADIMSAIEGIGTKRSDQKIYGRRNEVIHSIFGVTQDGAEAFQRIGDPGYLRPSPVNNFFLQNLVRDIWDVIGKINRVFPA